MMQRSVYRAADLEQQRKAILDRNKPVLAERTETDRQQNGDEGVPCGMMLQFVKGVRILLRFSARLKYPTQRIYYQHKFVTYMYNSKYRLRYGDSAHPCIRDLPLTATEIYDLHNAVLTNKEGWTNKEGLEISLTHSHWGLP